MDTIPSFAVGCEAHDSVDSKVDRRVSPDGDDNLEHGLYRELDLLIR